MEDEKDMKIKDIPFVILGPVRCGSSLLVETIKHHPDLDCKLEFFPTEWMDRLVKEYDTNDPIKILTKIINGEGRGVHESRPQRVAWEPSTGFKFLFSNYREETAKLYNLLLSCSSIRKILLTRNPLEGFISRQTAEELHKYWLGQDTSKTKITFNKEKFLQYIDVTSNNYTYALKRIAGPLITIDYKDICNTLCQKELYTFLNVPYIHTRLPKNSEVKAWQINQPDNPDGTTKQNHTQMSYRVENFTEMVEYISTTPYKKYLI